MENFLEEVVNLCQKHGFSIHMPNVVGDPEIKSILFLLKEKEMIVAVDEPQN